MLVRIGAGVEATGLAASLREDIDEICVVQTVMRLPKRSSYQVLAYQSLIYKLLLEYWRGTERDAVG